MGGTDADSSKENNWRATGGNKHRLARPDAEREAGKRTEATASRRVASRHGPPLTATVCLSPSLLFFLLPCFFAQPPRAVVPRPLLRD